MHDEEASAGLDLWPEPRERRAGHQRVGNAVKEELAGNAPRDALPNRVVDARKCVSKQCHDRSNLKYSVCARGQCHASQIGNKYADQDAVEEPDTE